MNIDNYTAKLLLRAYAQGMGDSVGLTIKVTDISCDGLIDIVAIQKDTEDLLAHTVCTSVVLARQLIRTIATNYDVLKALNYEESVTVDKRESEESEEFEDFTEDFED